MKRKIAISLSLITLLLAGCNEDEINSLTNEILSLRTNIEQLNKEKAELQAKVDEAAPWFKMTEDERKTEQQRIATESIKTENEFNNMDSIKNKSNSENNISEYTVGVYKVGNNIKPGEYCLLNRNNSDGSIAEIEIDTDSSGQFSSIGLMMDTNTFAYFVLQDGEYLNIKKGYVIPLNNYKKPVLSSYQSIPSGMYKVGTDIPAGEYELTNINNKNPYYVIYNEIPSSKENIFYNSDYFETNQFVTLKEGQYIIFKNSEMSLLE